MAETPHYSASESDDGVQEISLSEEHDGLPLKQRMKILFTQNGLGQSLPEVNPGYKEN